MENRVTKVHPLARDAAAEDPLEVVATPVEGGDPEWMLRCLVQEYAWMGWDAEQILTLFRDPFYPALNALWDHYGEAGIRERVAALVRESGVFHFAVTVREAPEPEEEEDDGLIQLNIRCRI